MFNLVLDRALFLVAGVKRPSPSVLCSASALLTSLSSHQSSLDIFIISSFILFLILIFSCLCSCCLCCMSALDRLDWKQVELQHQPHPQTQATPTKTGHWQLHSTEPTNHRPREPAETPPNSTSAAATNNNSPHQSLKLSLDRPSHW